MNISRLADEIIRGKRLCRGDDLSFLLTADLDELRTSADRIRSAIKGDKFNFCTIINGKSGRCSENCRFCAQSACHDTSIEEYPFLGVDRILEECRYNAKNGMHRFSIVTAGRALSDSDLAKAEAAYRAIRDELDIGLCASHGLLTDEQFASLKNAGVTRYHCNIETSERNFPNICTTHTYANKLLCIRRAQKNGLEVCSGGIIGMGETWDDRIDMAVSLAELGVVSIPLNVLIPIKGTPLGDTEPISHDDVLRTAALFRFIVPDADIRLAAGRAAMPDKGAKAFRSGVNSAITGDMLTTSGSSIAGDFEIVREAGFCLSEE